MKIKDWLALLSKFDPEKEVLTEYGEGGFMETKPRIREVGLYQAKTADGVVYWTPWDDEPEMVSEEQQVYLLQP